MLRFPGLESPGKGIDPGKPSCNHVCEWSVSWKVLENVFFESWKTLEFGLCKSWKTVF